MGKTKVKSTRKGNFLGGGGTVNVSHPAVAAKGSAGGTNKNVGKQTAKAARPA